LGLAALVCTALRAITTSYQQSDSPILVDTRLCIGPLGVSQKRPLMVTSKAATLKG